MARLHDLYMIMQSTKSARPLQMLWWRGSSDGGSFQSRPMSTKASSFSKHSCNISLILWIRRIDYATASVRSYCHYYRALI